MNVSKNIDIQCCGCKVCADACPCGAISFAENDIGFFYPLVNEQKCVSCGKCVDVCPFINVPRGNNPIQVYAATNNDLGIVKNSSSGGMFSPLATIALEENGLVAGCILDDSFKVRHILSESKDELIKMQKSKYVQSDLSGLYIEIKNKLKTGRPILFSGTPCEIAALKNILKDCDCSNLMFVDIVCHGTPSQQDFNDYLQHFENKSGYKIKKYIFRAKRSANDGMNWFSGMQFEDGRYKYFNWPADSFNYYYMRGALNRSSCYSCPYCSPQRQGDITLCDFWSWEKYHDEFKYGTQVSGVILNTEKGIDAFEKMCQTHSIVRVPSNIENIERHNSCLIKPLSPPEEQEEVLEIYKAYGYKGVDNLFKRKHWKSIWKYSVMMHIPRKLLLNLLKDRA